MLGVESIGDYEVACRILETIEKTKSYSSSLKCVVNTMINPNSSLRPTSQELIKNFLQNEIEVELQWEKNLNIELKKKMKALQEKLKIDRKNSF